MSPFLILSVSLQYFELKKNNFFMLRRLVFTKMLL